VLRRALLLTVLVASACVSHPVGPARTFGTYEGKARTTASSALSEVQTARLIATTASRGSAFGPYTGQVLSDAEDHVADVRIAARRGALMTLADVAAPLDGDIDALQSFLKAHGG